MKFSIEFEYKFFNYKLSFKFSKSRTLSNCITNSSIFLNSRSIAFKFTNIFMNEIQIQSLSINFITIDIVELNKNFSIHVFSIIIKYKSSIVIDKLKIFDKAFEKLIVVDVKYKKKLNSTNVFILTIQILCHFSSLKERKKRKKQFLNK